MTMLVLVLGTVILKMNIYVWAAAGSSTRVIWTIYWWKCQHKKDAVWARVFVW